MSAKLTIGGHTILDGTIGTIVWGTLLTNTTTANTAVKMYSLPLTKGTWLAVFMYRTDNQGNNISYIGFSGLVASCVNNNGATAIQPFIVSTETSTAYAYIQSNISYTWTSGSRVCYAIKIA